MGRHNLILIGFMGAGKTSVGEQLAERRHRTLIDTDRLVEEMAGKTVAEIFEQQGEAAFRQLEGMVLKELAAAAQGEVISVGGGLPLWEDNRQLLKALGMVLYLRVRPETVIGRLRGDSTRPLLQGTDMEEKVERLMAFRGPVYESLADCVVDADDKTVVQIGTQIEWEMKKWDREEDRL